MDVEELRRSHFRAAEEYFASVIELRRLRAAGVARRDYQIFWRDRVEPAGSVVRAARVALEHAQERLILS